MNNLTIREFAFSRVTAFGDFFSDSKKNMADKKIYIEPEIINFFSV